MYEITAICPVHGAVKVLRKNTFKGRILCPLHRDINTDFNPLSTCDLPALIINVIKINPAV
jgi:hypothetical protein